MDTRGRQSGFTMVEVLVAMLILGIGLLGMAGLQAHALRNNYNAYLRSQATFNIYEIMDRMRANREYAIKNAGYATAYGASVSAVDCSTSRCTPAQMKDADLAQWLAVVGRLPGGEGKIEMDSTEKNKVTVSVRWYDRRDGNATKYLEFTAASRL